MTGLLPVFARREPTNDSVARALKIRNKKDVVFYKDAACTQFFCRWPWHQTPPRSTKKKVTLDCYQWAVNWCTPLAALPA